MSDEQDKLKLSLEPPKLFGRKRKPDAEGTAEPSPAPTGVPDETSAEDDPAPGPAAEGTLEPAVEPEADPLAEVDPATEQEREPAPRRTSAAKKAAATTPAAKTAAKRTAKTAKTAKTAVKLPSPPDQPAAEPATATAATAPTTEVVDKPGRPRAKLAPDIEPEPVTRLDQEDAEIAAAAADEPPLLPPYPAAAVSGAIVGASMVLLIWVSLRGCETVRGTASCTGGPGFLLLVATFVLCVLLGSALLKVFSIPDPGSSSFLAVGLIAVVALLFLIEVLDHWSMLIVIPVVGAGAFLASVWVTRTFVEEDDTS